MKSVKVVDMIVKTGTI